MLCCLGAKLGPCRACCGLVAAQKLQPPPCKPQCFLITAQLKLLGVNLGHVEAMLEHLGLKMGYAMASYAYDGPFWGHVGLRPRPAKKHYKTRDFCHFLPLRRSCYAGLQPAVTKRKWL